MLFERRDGSELQQAAAGLTLGELVAMRPRHVRDALEPGERFPTGQRPGRRRAQGADLDGISPYVQGDDVRRIDWRATARTGRTQMKRFVAESHRARVLVVDFQRTMFFGTATRMMAKTAALAAARLAWEAFSLHEPIGLIILPGRESLAPRRGRRHLLRLLDHLQRAYERHRRDPSSDETLSPALEAAAASLRHGDEVCLLSDFGDRDAAFEETSRGLSAARRLCAFVVEDEILARPVPQGRYPICRPSGAGRTTATLSRRATERHAEAAAVLRRSLVRDLAGSGWHLASAGDLIPKSPEPGR